MWLVDYQMWSATILIRKQGLACVSMPEEEDNNLPLQISSLQELLYGDFIAMLALSDQQPKTPKMFDELQS